MISIAIDGYSGSGKGELCKGLAKKFNLSHLDTGAILRAMGLYFYNLNITSITDELIDKHFDNLNIKIEFENGVQHTYLNNKDVSSNIRQEVMGQMASRVAAVQRAMLKLIDISREFAKNNNCVMDGRNITSEVLPDADVKFFLDANVEQRAQRRFKESAAKGQQVSYEEVLESLKERDWRDTHRDFSPMIVTSDSFVIDNTHLTIEETVNKCCEIANEILSKKGKL